VIVTDRPGDPRIIFQWVAERARLVWSTDVQAIGEIRGDRIIAGVVYDGFLGGCCQMHQAIEGRMSRDFVHAAFHYPFVQLGLNCVLGIVAESNAAALKMDRHLGFKTLCRIKHGGRGGEDILLMEMRREDCRFLGGRYGQGRVGTGNAGLQGRGGNAGSGAERAIAAADCSEPA
jgi:hypothetical protein